MVPKVKFEVSRDVNEFCHLSVLYADLMPAELANGILRNLAYQEKHHRLRHDEVRLELQKTGPFATDSEWYRFAMGLMKPDPYRGFRSISGTSPFEELFRQSGLRGDKDFEEIWNDTMPRLVEYQYNFSRQWSTIGDRILLNLQELAKSIWHADEIRVHYIDCLYGGFGWASCIGLTVFPDLEVQKKLLTHELSELVSPQTIIAKALQRARLDPGITHTVVDMLAYFSAREFIARTDPQGREKKGIRPNPSYYPAADILFPVFERYVDNPSVYPDFESLMREIVSALLPMAVSPNSING